MSHIDSILTLTVEVESLISEGRWSDAADREVERRSLLVEYVEAEGHAAPHVRELYERSLHSMEHIRQLKSGLSGDASLQISNSRAVDAYLDTASVGNGSAGR